MIFDPGNGKPKKKVLIDALKYNSRSTWRANSPGASSYAERFNFFGEATKHMVILNEKGKWTKEKILTEAKKYKYKTYGYRN